MLSADYMITVTRGHTFEIISNKIDDRICNLIKSNKCYPWECLRWMWTTARFSIQWWCKLSEIQEDRSDTNHYWKSKILRVNHQRLKTIIGYSCLVLSRWHSEIIATSPQCHWQGCDRMFLSWSNWLQLKTAVRNVISSRNLIVLILF